MVLPGRSDKLWALKRKGYKIVAVSNQGGIGLGYLTKEQCEACLEELNKMLHGVFDLMLYAPAAPQKKDAWTKPNPGMLFHAADKLNIDLKKSLMVGDMATDRMAAERAGVDYTDAEDFFKETA